MHASNPVILPGLGTEPRPGW